MIEQYKSVFEHLKEVDALMETNFYQEELNKALNSDYQFPLAKFIALFYNSITSNKLDIAKSILDTINELAYIKDDYHFVLGWNVLLSNAIEKKDNFTSLTNMFTEEDNVKEEIEPKDYETMGDKYYEKGNYEKAIKCYVKATYTTPSSRIILKLASINVELKYYEEAINCYKRYMRDYPGSYDFSERIEDLKYLMKLDETIDQTMEFMQMVKEGIPLKEIFITLNIKEENQVYAYLLLAKEAYKEKDYKKGDHYLKMGEGSKHKSDATSKLTLIRRNKKFYANGLDEPKISITST